MPMRALFDAQFQASRAKIDPPLAVRRDRLRRMKKLIDSHGPALQAAVEADFGVRSSGLTEVADLFVLRALLSHLQRHLPRWMKPVRVTTPVYLQPASAYIQRQPLGVVGVISPWNYPLQLALAPAAAAMAAGNRVMLKPSELTPRTSALLAELVHTHYAAEEFCVIEGDAQVAAEFAALPFDHLFFTGSTAVGRKVAAAAAANLTPTTLELGGKSPAIIDASAQLADAALKIAHGKLLNAGQTCIAPDYVLLPRGQEAAFEAAFFQAVARLFPQVLGNGDYASVISERHLARLCALVEEARAAGARAVVVDPADAGVGAVALRVDPATRQLAPVLLFGVQPGQRVMEEEIFGPVLPVLPYGTLEEAIEIVNARPRPLALYWFGQDTAARDAVLTRTVSGGVSINDTLMHIAHENLPFGGVGESGWGAYHGHRGFMTFTHEKSVLVQSRLGLGHLFYPPYGERFRRVTGLLRKVL